SVGRRHGNIRACPAGAAQCRGFLIQYSPSDVAVQKPGAAFMSRRRHAFLTCVLLAVAWLCATTARSDELKTGFAAPATSNSSPRVGEIRGRVVDGGTGKPAAAVVVTIQTTKQSLAGKRNEAVCRETRTNAEGEYGFSELAPAAYNIWADAEERTCAALNSV